MGKKRLITYFLALAIIIPMGLHLGCTLGDNPTELVGIWRGSSNIYFNGRKGSSNDRRGLDLLKGGRGTTWDWYIGYSNDSVYTHSFDWKVVGDRLYMFTDDNAVVFMADYSISGSTLTLTFDTGNTMSLEKRQKH